MNESEILQAKRSHSFSQGALVSTTVESREGSLTLCICHRLYVRVWLGRESSEFDVACRIYPSEGAQISHLVWHAGVSEIKRARESRDIT